jgi:D-alanyl-D-alanine carboxypeptidase/D-alanyl-D-alanine-endopeptidase (penicillin-binding protein 4)
VTPRSRPAATALSWLAAAACSAPPAAAPFEAALARFVAAADALGGRVGVVVADGDSGRTLVACAADQGFVPASNQKLLTAAVALRTLGPTATLRTELYATGPIQAGTLGGDLVLRGFGDPTLGTPPGGDPRLTELVAAVQAAGVRRVAGRVRGDGSWLGAERYGLGWEWDDLDQDWAAPFGGLCCGGNVVEVLDGVAAPRRVPVADPAAFTAATLAGLLRAAGITIDDGELPAAGAGSLLATVYSPPVAALLWSLLGESDNLVAEQLWRVAARLRGEPGSVPAATHTRRELAALGVDPTGLVVADGSGLSRWNLVRPSQLVALLLAVRRAPFHAEFVGALPLAGTSGTLRTRCADGPARGRVRAKTGTLQRVTSLSGYLPQPRGGPLVFSVLWNDFLGEPAAARRCVDAFVEDLAAAAGW